MGGAVWEGRFGRKRKRAIGKTIGKREGKSEERGGEGSKTWRLFDLEVRQDEGEVRSEVGGQVGMEELRRKRDDGRRKLRGAPSLVLFAPCSMLIAHAHYDSPFLGPLRS